MSRRTWAEIHTDRLRENLRLIRSHLPQSTRVMAVVKANAYGHGDVETAEVLFAEGVRHFAVSNLDEALRLRAHGIKGMLLILGYTPPEAAGILAKEEITQTVYSLSFAKALSDHAVKAGVTVRAHLALDTGMGRIGFASDDPDDAVKEIEQARLSGIAYTGMFTHFAVADSLKPDDIAFTGAQKARFDAVAAKLRQQGLELPELHIQNSAATLLGEGMDYPIARCGIILYGLPPSHDVAPEGLRPVMEEKTVISMLKTIPAGHSVSYGRTFVAKRDTRVATLPVGYADGYFRLLSNRGAVLIHGKRAPVIGRVCMDQTMVDVTDIPEAKEGDTVTLFGEDGNAVLPLTELADTVGTINYELACAVSGRVKRVYR